MRKFYALLFCGILNFANAQVPNRGFEETAFNGMTIKNWGYSYAIPCIMDIATGTTTCEDILFENGLGFSYQAGDCVTGSWAMYLSNAFNFTQNNVLAGKATLFNDAISELPTQWNRGIPLAPNSVIQHLGFNYKFFPAGNDIAEARLELFSADGTSVGTAVVEISQPAFEFTYLYAPVNFTSSDTPVFMTIDFLMAREGSEPTFGTGLIIDDVTVNDLLSVSTQQSSMFTVFPTLADDWINIAKSNAQAGSFNFKIIDVNGKVVQQQKVEMQQGAPAQMNVSGLSKGFYVLETNNGNKSFTTKFIKK